MEITISKLAFIAIIKILGKLSMDDICRLIGEVDGKYLNAWYFDNRSKVND